MPVLLRAIHADITTLAIDATVNAANTSPLGGGALVLYESILGVPR